MEGGGAGATTCCLRVSSVRSDLRLSSQFEFKALSAPGKTTRAFIREEGKASRSSPKNQRSLMPSPFTHASPGVLFFSPVLQNLCVPFSCYSCTIILSSHPDLLPRRVVCKKFKSIFRGKHFYTTYSERHIMSRNWSR